MWKKNLCCALVHSEHILNDDSCNICDFKTVFSPSSAVGIIVCSLDEGSYSRTGRGGDTGGGNNGRKAKCVKTRQNKWQTCRDFTRKIFRHSHKMSGCFGNFHHKWLSQLNLIQSFGPLGRLLKVFFSAASLWWNSWQFLVINHSAAHCQSVAQMHIPLMAEFCHFGLISYWNDETWNSNSHQPLFACRQRTFASFFINLDAANTRRTMNPTQRWPSRRFNLLRLGSRSHFEILSHKWVSHSDVLAKAICKSDQLITLHSYCATLRTNSLYAVRAIERVPAGTCHFSCLTDPSQSVVNFPCVRKWEHIKTMCASIAWDY